MSGQTPQRRHTNDVNNLDPELKNLKEEMSKAINDFIKKKGGVEAVELAEPSLPMATGDIRNPEINTRYTNSNQGNIPSNYKREKGKGKSTKSHISLPSNFRHVGHVGWDPNTGFDVDNLDPELKNLFDMCGISEVHLKDKVTSKAIYDFIEKKGGVEAVKREFRRQAPPPSSSQGGLYSLIPTSRGRGAPPPPSPIRASASAPPSRPGMRDPPPEQIREGMTLKKSEQGNLTVTVAEPSLPMATGDIRNPEINTRYTNSNQGNIPSNYKREKGKGKSTKSHISLPSNFRHVGHVGWDPNTGFDVDNLDPELKNLFDMCGISEVHLRDKETSKAIYDFIEKKGGVEAVKREFRRQAPPPSSSQGGLYSLIPTSRGRGAPPPPSPIRASASAPPSRPGMRDPPPEQIREGMTLKKSEQGNLTVTVAEPSLPMATGDIRNPEINTRYTNSNQGNIPSNYKREKGNGKSTKSHISLPSNFRHVGHVGWDPNTGFDVDNLDPELKNLFDMCGISEVHLRDKETSKAIYDFIEKKGGVEAVKSEFRRQAPPPSSSQGGLYSLIPTSRGRGAPPPPSPIRASASAPPSRPGMRDPPPEQIREGMTLKKSEQGNLTVTVAEPSLLMATGDIRNPEINTRYTNSNQGNIPSNYKREKGNGKSTKSHISLPSNFQHVGHVGWDPNTGFDVDNLDPELKNLFDMCGISEVHLRDKETSKAIYDFIEKKGGVEAVKSEFRRQAPPPSTSQGGLYSLLPTSRGRGAPPPPSPITASASARPSRPGMRDPPPEQIREGMTLKKSEQGNLTVTVAEPSLPMATGDIRNPEINTRYTNSNQGNIPSNYKREKGNGKSTKSHISLPSNFRHVGHVGWDPNTGFDVDNLDPELKNLFDMCGISEVHLRDKETSKAIYDFIEKKGGVEAVKSEFRRQAPPPSSSQGGLYSLLPTSRGRGAPPPPSPIRASASAPPSRPGMRDPPPEQIREGMTLKKSEQGNLTVTVAEPSLPMATGDIRNPEINTRYTNSNQGNIPSNYKREKGKGKSTKSHISLPSNFRHVGHVGWDPNTGFDMKVEDRDEDDDDDEVDDDFEDGEKEED